MDFSSYLVYGLPFNLDNLFKINEFYKKMKGDFPMDNLPEKIEYKNLDVFLSYLIDVLEKMNVELVETSPYQDADLIHKNFYISIKVLKTDNINPLKIYPQEFLIFESKKESLIKTVNYFGLNMEDCNWYLNFNIE